MFALNPAAGSCIDAKDTKGQDPSSIDLARSIQCKLQGAENVLLWGVGGGNDSVTALLLPAQFERDFGFMPKRLQVAAMLPDVLDYSELMPIVDNVVYEITPSSKRSVGGQRLDAFPEPLLAAHKSRFGVERVVGLSMAAGSAGLTTALQKFIHRERFDLVLACDVGGDFIATPDNLNVLSPMMDAYALNALRSLQQIAGTEFLYCVFGLGTDGESNPHQLTQALDNIGNYLSMRFESGAIADVHEFYRKIIEVNRKSRTADFTLRSIHGERLEPTIYRARFHTRPNHGEVRKYYGEFLHAFGEEFAGRYYIFEDLEGIQNPFELHCVNGVEWFIGVQRIGKELNNEMNGQSYACIESVLGLSKEFSHSIFFGTPSFRFSAEQRAQILRDTTASVGNGVYDAALIFKDDLRYQHPGRLKFSPVGQNLVLAYRDRDVFQSELLDALSNLGA